MRWPAVTGKSRRSASARALPTPAASRSPHDAPPPRGGAGGATGPGGTQRHRSSGQRHPRLHSTRPALTRLTSPSASPAPPAATPIRASPSATRGAKGVGQSAPHRSAPEELRAPPPASPVWPEVCIRLVDWSSAASLLAAPLTDWRRSRGARAEAVGGQAGAMAAVAQCVRAALRPRYPLLSFSLR